MISISISSAFKDMIARDLLDTPLQGGELRHITLGHYVSLEPNHGGKRFLFMVQINGQDIYIYNADTFQK